MSGSDNRFGGRTAKVHAGATEILLFDQRDALASFGKIVCQGNARLSCPNNQYIKAVVLCHSVLANSALVVIVQLRLPEVIWRSRCTLFLASIRAVFPFAVNFPVT